MMTKFAIREALLVLLFTLLVSRGVTLDDRCATVPNLSYIPSANACYLYYSCIDGNAYPQTCSDGLWFSTERQGCVEKEDSDCELTEPPTRPEAPAPDPSPRCDNVPNFSYIASGDSCQWYYQCIDRIAYRVSCPRGDWFDEELQRCGSRYEVQCDREPGTTSTIPTPQTVDPLDLCEGQPNTALIPSLTFCERYYSCYEGYPYPQICPTGLWFNPATLECDEPENVECTAGTKAPQHYGEQQYIP